jgi:riboflavin synthase
MMFTGIVEHTGRVMAARGAGRGKTFEIAAGFDPLLAPGESIAVNGVCLTVERADAAGFEVTAVEETLSLTTLADLSPGSRVNLERAATLSRLFGGHIVQGHVDGVGRVVAFGGSDEGDRLLEIELPEDVHDLCVLKGSIAIDGTSLTVARKLDERRIAIAIVPYTIEHTVVSEYRQGHRVNVEADVIARYVREQLRKVAASGR